MYVSEVTLSSQGCILKILLLPPFSQSAELSHNEVCLTGETMCGWRGEGLNERRRGGEKERGLRGAINGHFNGSIKRYQSVPLCRPILIQTSVCYFYLFQVKFTH